MKVLQINAVYKHASTGRTCFELQNELKKYDIQCYTAYGQKKGSAENTFYMGNKTGSKIHAALSRISGLHGYYSTFSTRKLISFIQREGFDIIHLRNMHSQYINIVLLLKFLKKHNYPVVITLHDCWFYTGKCTHYTSDGCDKWKTGCDNCVRLKKDIPSLLFDRTKKMFSDKKRLLEDYPRLAVIGVSEWITNEARQSFLKNASIIKRIYNWVDLEVFRRMNQISKKTNQFTILGVASSWLETKGINKFIELAGMLEDEIIVLIGHMDSTVRLPENIVSVPPTNSVEELAEYYNMAGCLVNLSKEESFGKVVAEALACGTPAVVYDSTALGELVGEDCGIVLHSENIADVYEAIKTIRNRGKQYYCEKCAEFACKYFDLHKNVKEYVDVYHALAGI